MTEKKTLTNRKWKEKNRDKVREQNRRYRIKYPEKVREQRKRYLDKKFRESPELMKKLEGQLKTDFDRLTRILYDNILQKKCEKCGKTENLHIHHKRYVYPIVKEDLIRLCRECHNLEHNHLKFLDDMNE